MGQSTGQLRTGRGLCPALSRAAHQLPLRRVLWRRSQRHYRLCRLLPPRQQLPRLPLHHGEPLPVSDLAAPSQLPTGLSRWAGQAARTTLGGSAWHQGRAGPRADLHLSPLLACWASLVLLSSSLAFMEHVWGGLPQWLSGKESTRQCRRHKRSGFDPWVGKISWRRTWQPTPVFLPENPMDRAAWQALVHRVAQNQTRLK